MRIEHWDVAFNQGKTAAFNMLGPRAGAHVVPYFFSDLADWVSMEYVGPGSGDPVVRGSMEEGEFSVFYVDDGRVTAAMSVGRSDDLDHARRFLADRVQVDEAALARPRPRPRGAALMAAGGRAERFRELHHGERPLLLPNPWDRGSAKLLESLGFEALATTSSGFAATLGRLDGMVSRDEAIAHAAELVDAVEVPVSADLENCFADDPAGVAETVRLAIEAGLAGCSIEDFSGRESDTIYEPGLAAERVAAAAEAAHSGERGLVLTARAENHVHGRDDLADTIARLQSFQEAGADVLFAPGVRDARPDPRADRLRRPPAERAGPARNADRERAGRGRGEPDLGGRRLRLRGLRRGGERRAASCWRAAPTASGRRARSAARRRTTPSADVATGGQGLEPR